MAGDHLLVIVGVDLSVVGL